ncbi:alpha/beta fold hydrolase [Chitinophagaceae bacterium LB-8]|uniref:Alpha/beta fold hydrolase n=1 Tax=Paraflavisolibacter caeni TaxID=2982496 RepID=A0A9X2Y1A9_9BACT|nr:alpha/beta fold hydrolase [Paraflavisolibacter caeni]MCU7552677.1 alpha/beta fold hydrolase [Paraflavisolibacter caeni]
MTVSKNILITGSEQKPIPLDIFYQEVKPNPVVIYAHGFNGFKDWGNFDLIARQFAETGFTFIKFNFSHNGTTPSDPENFVDLEAYGNNNYTKELYDLQAVIDWALDGSNPHAAAIDINRLFLIGHSKGGGIVLLKAAEEERVKGVATWASVSECKTPWGSWDKEKIEKWKNSGVEFITNSRTKQQMPIYFQLYEDYQNNKDRLQILEAVKQLKVPILICHGIHDEAVPVAKARELHQASNNSELFLVDSDHVFGRKHPWTKPVLPNAMQQVVSKTTGFFAAIG